MTDSDNLVVRTTQDLYRVPLAPRRKPMPIPSIGIFDDPTVCLKVNREWYSHVLGVLQVLCEPDAWEGSDDEILDAIGEIEKMLATAEENCEMSDYVKFIGDCNEDGLLVTQVVGGVETTSRIDIAACVPVPTTYLQSAFNCGTGVIQFQKIQPGGAIVEEVDMKDCLDGYFAKVEDIPSPLVPELVGNDLWFDTNGDFVADLNVGRVVYPGSDGADGAPAPAPVFEIIAGDLWVDTNADDEYQNLGRIVGEDGECLGCDAAPAPEQTDDPENDGLMCSIAINEAKYLRAIWDKAYNDDDGVIAGYINALITGATVLAYFFPGAAVAAFIGGLLLTLMKNITALEANEFDNAFEEKVRCDLYCILLENSTTVITEAIIAAWADKIREGSNTYEAYAADLVQYTPLTEFQWTAYASSAVDPAACLACDCEETDPNCEVFDFTIDNGGFTAANLNTGYVAGVGWKITASGSNTIDLVLPVRTKVVSSVEIEATGTDAANRVYVSTTNPGGTPEDTGVAPYVVTGLSISINSTTRLRIAHDWTPGNTPLGTAVITKITVCYTTPV